MPHFVNRDKNFVISTNYKVLFTLLSNQPSLQIATAKEVQRGTRPKRQMGYFLLVRDPYKRLESFYKNKLRQLPSKKLYRYDDLEPSQKAFCPDLKISSQDSPNAIREKLLGLSFAQFINLLPRVYQKDEHLHPQVWKMNKYNDENPLISPIIFDLILKIESADDMAYLQDKLCIDLSKKYNSTHDIQLPNPWQPSLRAVVNDLYQADFEKLNYKMHKTFKKADKRTCKRIKVNQTQQRTQQQKTQQQKTQQQKTQQQKVQQQRTQQQKAQQQRTQQQKTQQQKAQQQKAQQQKAQQQRAQQQRAQQQRAQKTNLAVAKVDCGRTPLVSCIMPTYNRQRFVSQSIWYFLRQDYTARELIIVDDGSDAVADLVPNDERIRYIRLERKHSVGTKRNLACEVSRGELIAHWDDDNWYAPNRLSLQVRELLSSKKDICGTSDFLFYHLIAGQAWRYRDPSNRRPWLAGSTLLYRRSAWKAHPFPDYDVGEDTVFVRQFRPDCLHLVTDSSLTVGIIHQHNTTPPNLKQRHWQQCSLSEVTQLLASERSFYVALRKDRPVPMPNFNYSTARQK